MQPVNSSNSDSANNNTINNALRQLSRDQIVKVFKNSTGNGIIQGQLPGDEGYGELLYDSTGLARVVLRVKNDNPEFKISKPGKDVLTAANNNLIFNSNQNVFKIVGTGMTSLTIPSVSASATFDVSVPHNLGFAPIPFVFISDPSGFYSQLPYAGGLSPNGLYVGFNVLFQAVTTASNITINAYTGKNAGNPAISGTFNFTYYLLQESAGTT